MENLGQSCIELRIPHTKRTDRRTEGRWSLEGAQKMPIKTLGNSDRDGPWSLDAKFLAAIRNFYGSLCSDRALCWDSRIM